FTSYLLSFFFHSFLPSFHSLSLQPFLTLLPSPHVYSPTHPPTTTMTPPQATTNNNPQGNNDTPQTMEDELIWMNNPHTRLHYNHNSYSHNSYNYNSYNYNSGDSSGNGEELEEGEIAEPKGQFSGLLLFSAFMPTFGPAHLTPTKRPRENETRETGSTSASAHKRARHSIAPTSSASLSATAATILNDANNSSARNGSSSR
ncbi:MAG: hypothetical protein J3R72DRAFT_514348, partial [Linnemannia gamsii]